MIDDFIVFYAFRYALGRKTYAVFDVTSYILDHYNDLHGDTKELMKREIRQAIKTGNAGMDIDVKMWRKVLEVLDE